MIKKILSSLVLAVVALCSCNAQLSTDYTCIGPSSSVFYDNQGKLCREGGVNPEWVVKGMTKMIDGETYAFYVVPKRQARPYYALWEQARYHQAYISETGWVRLSDLSPDARTSRIWGAKTYILHV